MIYTSCFGRVRKIKQPCYPVAIARGIPEWYEGRVYEPLMPSWQAVKMADDEFDPYYLRVLDRLDVRKVLSDVGDNAVLLCWEAPGKPCHRRMVAQWIKRETGMEVPEYGIENEGPRVEQLMLF